MNELGGYAFVRVGMCATFAKTVTKADIVLFAAVSGDNNAIHINEEFAAGTIFKGRIAHGLLSSSRIFPPNWAARANLCRSNLVAGSGTVCWVRVSPNSAAVAVSSSQYDVVPQMIIRSPNVRPGEFTIGDARRLLEPDPGSLRKWTFPLSRVL
jgi:MaoC like domain